MKIFALLAVLLCARSATADSSMTGWELYSWFDMKCSARPHVHSAPNHDSVCFALLPGTNRIKTVDEIRKAPMGIAALEKRIATLAPGDEVFWSAPDASFSIPDAKSANEPRNRAVALLKKRGLKLSIRR